MVDKINILGLPVGAYTMTSLFERLKELIAAPGCSTAYGLNAHSLNLSYKHPEFYRALSKGDALYVDGASLLVAARLLGKRLPERLTTTDLWLPLCVLAVRRNLSFFLLGGEPGLMERAERRALILSPGLNIVGTHHGFFEGRDEEIVALINEKKPDILWVGTGEPRQAVWLEKYKNQLDVSLAITCGGMFKIVAGELKRLPIQWRRRGCEWVYRMVQEPRTARRYLLGLPLFGLRVMAQALHFPVRSRKTVSFEWQDPR